MPRRMHEPLASEILNYIRHYISEHGYAPTQQEISRCCYISRTHLIRYLQGLEERGVIRRLRRKHRGIRLLLR